MGREARDVVADARPDACDQLDVMGQVFGALAVALPLGGGHVEIGGCPARDKLEIAGRGGVADEVELTDGEGREGGGEEGQVERHEMADAGLKPRAD